MEPNETAVNPLFDAFGVMLRAFNTFCRNAFPFVVRFAEMAEKAKREGKPFLFDSPHQQTPESR